MSASFLWPTTRRHRWLLVIILLLGTALRLWIWWRSPVHQPANDEVEYLAVARDLLAGRGWRFYDTYHWLRAPLYPLWLAGSLWLSGGDLRWAALPNVTLSSLTVYLFYLLGREAGAGGSAPAARAERVGLLAAGAAAGLLTFVTFASLWMSETLFTALFVAALLALLRCSWRPRPALAVAAGVLLGLSILTRSLPLTLLPAAALWLALAVRRSRIGDQARPDPVAAARAAVAYALGFVLVTALTIAPWTLRNYQAYGAFIAVETGLSYNLWWFNEPREGEDTIFRTLESIPNPAERADYATAKGLERLREDPAILLRKAWPNLGALWLVKPIEDRFLLRSYYENPTFAVFALSLALDDLLYAVSAVAGLTGLLLAPLDRRKLLLGGWLLYVVVVVVLTHGEGRYRHFIFPVLLPYAAWLVASWRDALWPRRRWQLAAGLGVLAVLWMPLVYHYPRDWAGTNLRRGWVMQRAEWAAQRGDLNRAIDLTLRANSIDPDSVDVLLRRGQLLLAAGRPEAALSAFDSAFLVAPGHAAVSVSRGDALRRLGRLDEARRAFKGYYDTEAELLAWAWDVLDTPPPATLDVGGQLDYGFVQGMYAAEQQGSRTVRWTYPAAALRLPGSSSDGILRLTMAAPRPEDQAVPARICVGALCRAIELGPGWRTFELLVPPAEQHLVTITVEPFSASSRDQRTLGLMIDAAAVTALPTPDTLEAGAVQSRASRMETASREHRTVD